MRSVGRKNKSKAVAPKGANKIFLAEKSGRGKRTNIMNKFFLSVLAVLAIGLATAQGQANIFKGQTVGSNVKVGAGGAPDFTNTGTATSTVHAATLNADSGTLTTESITTAAGSTYTFTLTNSKITAASKVFVSFQTAGTGTPVLTGVVQGSGTCDIKITNVHATAAFNALFKIAFKVET